MRKGPLVRGKVVKEVSKLRSPAVRAALQQDEVGLLACWQPLPVPTPCEACLVFVLRYVLFIRQKDCYAVEMCPSLPEPSGCCNCFVIAGRRAAWVPEHSMAE